jgi:hypothetical protein
MDDPLEDPAMLSREALEDDLVGMMKPWLMTQPCSSTMVDGRLGL